VLDRLSKLVQCLADDLELTLHRRLEQLVVPIVGERLAAGECAEPFGCLECIPQVLARIRAAYSASLVRITRSWKYGFSMLDAVTTSTGRPTMRSSPSFRSKNAPK
jgi:hypothetical protein